MKKTLIFLLLASLLISLSSCISLLSVGPDGVNDNLFYGYVDTTTIGDGKYFKLFFIPLEMEYVKDNTFNGERYILENQKRDWDDLKYSGMPMDRHFMVQNLPPGDYYLGKITHMYFHGNTLIEKDIKLPKPENMEMVIHIEKNQLNYWGTASIIISNDMYQLVNNNSVTKEEVGAMLKERIKGSTWESFVSSRL